MVPALSRVLAIVLVVVGLSIPGATIGACAGPISTGTPPTVTPSACVPDQALITPMSREWVRVWTSQALTVHKGMFVDLQVTEPEADTTTEGFPWGVPVMSTGAVLTPASPCHAAPPATLPVAVHFFRAVDVGSTTVVVPLSKSWLARVRSCLDTASCVPLSDLRISVTVAGG